MNAKDIRKVCIEVAIDATNKMATKKTNKPFFVSPDWEKEAKKITPDMQAVIETIDNGSWGCSSGRQSVRELTQGIFKVLGVKTPPDLKQEVRVEHELDGWPSAMIVLVRDPNNHGIKLGETRMISCDREDEEDSRYTIVIRHTGKVDGCLPTHQGQIMRAATNQEVAAFIKKVPLKTLRHEFQSELQGAEIIHRMNTLKKDKE